MLQFPPPERFIETIRSRIAEAMGLGSYDFRPVAIPMGVPLSTTTTRGVATFTIPRIYKLRLTRILPIVCPVDPAGEKPSTSFGSVVVANASGNVVNYGSSIADSLLMKAHNCRVDLKLNNGNFNLNPVPSIALSDFFGKDRRWSALDTPLSLPPGSNIQMVAGLQDTTSDAVGGTTNYGLILVGQLIRYQP